MSRGFVCCLVGIAMTVFSWFGPWAWPAWPAFAVIDSAYGSNANFADQDFNTKAAVVVGLIVLNVTVWAVVALVASIAARRLFTVVRGVNASGAGTTA